MGRGRHPDAQRSTRSVQLWFERPMVLGNPPAPGMIFGGLAAWRKTLRVGMVAHGWQDIWAGWLSQVVFR